MRVASIINPVGKRHTHLARVLALFFLIFTGADLFMPQYFCAGEEVGNLPPQSRVAKTNAGTIDESKTVALYSSQESQPGESPEREAPHEEDCFCCCAHVLLGLSFKNAEYSEIKSPRAPAEMPRLLSPPLQSTYHPPRFA
jgi:hypothetical protein